MTANYSIIQCSFCKRTLHSYEKDNNYTRIFTNYDCDDCGAEFVVDEDSQQIVNYSLSDEDYRLQFNLLTETCEIRKAYSTSTYINKGPGYHSNWRTILNLSCLPDNVTPQNIGSKIKTYLTFS